jgi:hypothetical protein
MIDLGEIKWTCHICGIERSDNKISVHSRVTCVARAPLRNLFKGGCDEK